MIKRRDYDEVIKRLDAMLASTISEAMRRVLENERKALVEEQKKAT
jgi:hypothetical protein